MGCLHPLVYLWSISNLDPEPLLFKSVGEGSRALNYGKIYSGLHEPEGHDVPCVYPSFALLTQLSSKWASRAFALLPFTMLATPLQALVNKIIDYVLSQEIAEAVHQFWQD
ncbi:hypothetical protein K435DRAFT_866872 [Dendrothele bispora CBS 962.96]|uniref:Uncharacterized protein n=1 Tax=Dendrothele bispora (strain CBS 962.96) TaxID=1314807 RepID=A0A4S8LFN8_DENBC|nr:hypothetical protein K435DRAFT_866872 [Dendrothele bispora CBS 962.96]